MIFFSPAKINLFFRVLKKRDDGYHEIASLYQAIGLGDTLTIELHHRDELSCTDPLLATDERNLVLKAVHLFRKKTGLAITVKIDLHKQIPIEAGLGGGSSNAATTLWALNLLAGSPVSFQDLALWSCELGSDSAFFFSKGTAFCTGRGEVFSSLENFSIPTSQKLWIAKPSYGLPTPSVYQACDLSLITPRDPQEALSRLAKGEAYYFNDLENPAFTLIPQLAILKKNLLELGFSSVTMTGSGTAFFCFGPKTLTPHLPGIKFYATTPLLREDHDWYKTPQI